MIEMDVDPNNLLARSLKISTKLLIVLPLKGLVSFRWIVANNSTESIFRLIYSVPGIEDPEYFYHSVTGHFSLPCPFSPLLVCSISDSLYNVFRCILCYSVNDRKVRRLLEYNIQRCRGTSIFK